MNGRIPLPSDEEALSEQLYDLERDFEGAILTARNIPLTDVKERVFFFVGYIESCWLASMENHGELDPRIRNIYETISMLLRPAPDRSRVSEPHNGEPKPLDD